VYNKIIHTIPSWTNLDASTPFRNMNEFLNDYNAQCAIQIVVTFGWLLITYFNLEWRIL